jgi:hypothetical protein
LSGISRPCQQAKGDFAAVAGLMCDNLLQAPDLYQGWCDTDKVGQSGANWMLAKRGASITIASFAVCFAPSAKKA